MRRLVLAFVFMLFGILTIGDGEKKEGKPSSRSPGVEGFKFCLGDGFFGLEVKA